MAPQTGEQTITINILPNIWKSEGNQIRKLGQLIEYNMSRKITHKKQWRN